MRKHIPALLCGIAMLVHVTTFAQANTASPAQTLTRQDAEALALRNNPRISVAQLLALAQGQVTRQQRSAEMPQITGALTAVQTNTGSRIAAGALNNSRLVTHAGGGINVSQLITDFGHTGNLVAAAKLDTQAEQASTLATREDVVLVTDRAFYAALQAQELLRVAQQNVATRQATQSQIGELTRNKLRSTLDLSIANVTVSQAKLLAIDASDNVESSMANLDEVLGLDHPALYSLVDDAPTGASPPPPAEVEPLLAQAIAQRPDLHAQQLTEQAEHKRSMAASDQNRPTISALGNVGGDPVRSGRYFASSWDGAVGANVSIPIFNGSLYSAQAKEAQLRADAAGKQAQVLRDHIVRDVQTAWLASRNAFQRIAVTEELAKQADTSLQLAQTRYKLGLSSIVELSQAQLAQTQAEIDHTNALYGYQLALANLAFTTGQQP